MTTAKSNQKAPTLLQQPLLS